MVKGLDVFRDWFNGFESCYTLIGGAACDLWMGDRDLGFPPQRSRQVLGEDCHSLIVFKDKLSPPASCICETASIRP